MTIAEGAARSRGSTRRARTGTHRAPSGVTRTTSTRVDVLDGRDDVARLDGRGRAHDADVVERRGVANVNADSDRHAGSLTQRATRVELAARDLVLVFPVLELRPRAGEHDPVAGDAARADLAGVEVSTMSGAISVESMRTRIGASVSLRIWCAPSLPRGKATTSPSRSTCSPSCVRSVGSPRRTITHSSFAWCVWYGPACRPARPRTCSRRSARRRRGSRPRRP